MGLLPDGDKQVKQPCRKTAKYRFKPAVKKYKIPAWDNERFTYLKNPLHYGSWAFVSLCSNRFQRRYHSRGSFLTDMHISDTVAATAGGITLGIGAIAALSSGWLADRFDSRYVTISFLLCHDRNVDTDTGYFNVQIWPFVIIYRSGNRCRRHAFTNCDQGYFRSPRLQRDVRICLLYCCPLVFYRRPAGRIYV